MKITREIKTAILVIISLLLIVFLFNYLKGQNLFSGSRIFYTVYDNVEGLSTSSPVTISGNVVGKVNEISFLGDGTGKIKVGLLLANDFKFSKNSEIQLYENGLIGGKAIAIVPAFDGAENAQNNDILRGTVKGGLSELLNQKLTPLQEKIESMTVSADELLSNINSIFDEDTKANLKQSISELRYTITSFKDTSNAFNELIVDNEAKLDSTLTNVNNISASMASITDAVEKANLTAAINDLQTTVNNFNQVITAIKNGEGSIGKLLKDEGLYNNLEGASHQLEQLLQDMKLNPKRYVHFSLFGKKAPVYDADGNEIKEKQKP